MGVELSALEVALDGDSERTNLTDLVGLAVTSLAPRGVLTGIRLSRLQEFLWHEIPIYWNGELEIHLAVAAELGERFAAAGMTAHALLCTCARTEQIIWTYGTLGHDAGLAAYWEAMLEAAPAATAGAD